MFHKIGLRIVAGCAVGLSVTAIGAPVGAAEPSPFPNLDTYTPVNPDDYKIDAASPGHPQAARIYFTTPDGLQCAFNSPPSAGCTGELPGIPNRDNSEYYAAATYLTGFQRISKEDSASVGARALPPFRSITVNGVVCGVDDTGMTACKDAQGRAFILSPQGSRSLHL